MHFSKEFPKMNFYFRCTGLVSGTDIKNVDPYGADRDICGRTDGWQRRYAQFHLFYRMRPRRFGLSGSTAAEVLNLPSPLFSRLSLCMMPSASAGKPKIRAKVLNEMMELFPHMGKDVSMEDKLKEFVGHTPLQVLAYAILGILVAFAVHGLI